MQPTLKEQLRSVLVRESSTSLVLELPQLLVYRLDMAETISTSVPAACLRSGSQLRPEHIAGAPFRMMPPAGRAMVGGSLLIHAQEASVQSMATQLAVSLRADGYRMLSGYDQLDPPSPVEGPAGLAAVTHPAECCRACSEAGIARRCARNSLSRDA